MYFLLYYKFVIAILQLLIESLINFYDLLKYFINLKFKFLTFPLLTINLNINESIVIILSCHLSPCCHHNFIIFKFLYIIILLFSYFSNFINYKFIILLF